MQAMEITSPVSAVHRLSEIEATKKDRVWMIPKARSVVRKGQMGSRTTNSHPIPLPSLRA